MVTFCPSSVVYVTLPSAFFSCLSVGFTLISSPDSVFTVIEPSSSVVALASSLASIIVVSSVLVSVKLSFSFLLSVDSAFVELFSADAVFAVSPFVPHAVMLNASIRHKPVIIILLFICLAPSKKS